MISAKNVQSNNKLDVDSNLNVIYQQLDGLRECQPQSLYLEETTAHYGGYNSEYVDVVFTNASTNFYSDALAFNSEDSTISVDSDVYATYAVRCSLQYYTTGVNPNSTVYIKFVEIDGNGNESTINPFYRFPVGSKTSDGYAMFSFNQSFSVKASTKKIKMQITTNDTVQPSYRSVNLEITGVSKQMN